MIKAINRLVRGLKGMLGVPKAGIETDPYAMFNAMAAMPNPDQVLRGMGRAEQVYFSIMGDAHVIGDLRSIRGSFRSHEYRLVIGNDGELLPRPDGGGRSDPIHAQARVAHALVGACTSLAPR